MIMGLPHPEQPLAHDHETRGGLLARAEPHLLFLAVSSWPGVPVNVGAFRPCAGVSGHGVPAGPRRDSSDDSANVGKENHG